MTVGVDGDLFRVSPPAALKHGDRLVPRTFVGNILNNGEVTVTRPSPGPGGFDLGLLFDNSGGARANAARRRAVTVASCARPTTPSACARRSPSTPPPAARRR